jgi:hypothetical protein
MEQLQTSIRVRNGEHGPVLKTIELPIYLHRLFYNSGHDYKPEAETLA